MGKQLSFQLDDYQVPVSNGPSTGEVDLDFRGIDTLYATHAIHPYVAAMNPSLARWLIERYTEPSETVYDPFCGGGCVPVECLLMGRQLIGSDVNPLAVLITRAKTTRLESKTLLNTLDSILRKATKGDIAGTIPDVPEVSFWFKPDTVPILANLRGAVESLQDEEVRQLFLAVFSACVRDVMLTYRGEVRLRRLKGGDLERFQPNALAAFRKRAELAMGRVSQLPPSPRPMIHLQDVRDVSYPDLAFDHIICSPPYGDDKNGVSYFQFSKNMLFWLGFSPVQIETYKAKTLGYDKSNLTIPPSSTLQAALNAPHLRDNEGHRREAIAFYRDYLHALKQMCCVTRGIIAIVTGTRVLSKTLINNAAITAELMAFCGWTLRERFTRRLPRKRIPNFGLEGGQIQKEDILIFSRV